MIRPLAEMDYQEAISIVNENWKSIYAEYVNPDLLGDAGCSARELELMNEFRRRDLGEYVWEEDGQVLALLSIGDTADSDKAGAFEIWRIYIAQRAQGNGIGSRLLAFAEAFAKEKGYGEIVIWAFKENTRAIAFYQKHGYRIEKEEYLEAPYFAYSTRLLKRV